MTVVQFPKPTPSSIANDPAPPDAKRVYVCECGCYSFALCVDGSIICADCDALMETDAHQLRGSWWTPLVAADLPEYSDEDPPMSATLRDGLEFQRRRLSQRAGEADWVLCGRFDGTVTSWVSGPALSATQLEWLLRSVERAIEMLDVECDDAADDPVAP